MEKLKVKHDHTFTDIVKVAIFSLFLLLPLFVFAPTAFYYGFNEHAKNETTTEVDIQYKYETNEVNSIEDLVSGNIYSLDLSDYTENRNRNILRATYVSGYDNDNNFVAQDVNGGDSYILLVYNYTDDLIDVSVVGNFQTLLFQIEKENVNFVLLSDTNFNGIFIDYVSYTNYNVIESVDVQTDVSQSITQQMYNAWKTTWQSPLFNWTGNNNFTFTINAFTNVFGITEQSYLTNYINYLLTLTAIYVIFDIVIVLFTKMTHLLNG